MKLDGLGTNAAFAKEGVNNSFILWDNDGLGILLDCGFSVYQALLEKGYAEKLKAVLVSHLHQDHCGSLVNLLDYRYKVLGQTTAVAGAPDDKFMFMHSGNGWEAKTAPLPDELRLDTFEVPHAKGMRCLSLMVNEKLYYSGDSAISLLDTPAAAKAEMIIHDVSLSKGGIIASIDELNKAPADIKAKTFVSHYLPKDYDALAEKVQQYGLGGVLKPGDVFELK